jgi:tripartite-type tricarboxylate transporter receptor subunit TctC
MTAPSGRRCGGVTMKLPRRNILNLVAGAAAIPIISRVASADAYPTRPVRIIVGFAVGGPNDICARLIGQWLSERLGQPFVSENRPGAGGNLATEVVVRAAADGYTLLLVNPANAINSTLYEKLPFDFIGDIAPVACILRAPNVLVVNPSFPAKTVSEFVAYAKANPGKINLASPGIGTMPHVAGELFKLRTGVKLVSVRYRGGGPALVDLLSGQVQVMFESILSTMALIRLGKLRALAVTSATRLSTLPDVPTVTEFVPDYEATSWYGVGAPKQTPTEIVDKLNKEINAGLVASEIKERLEELGGTALPMSAAEFAKLIADETDKWRKVIQAANIKPE